MHRPRGSRDATAGLSLRVSCIISRLQGNRARSKSFEQSDAVCKPCGISDKASALVQVFTHHWRATFRKTPMLFPPKRTGDVLMF
jgi:hypothetical protein